VNPEATIATSRSLTEADRDAFTIFIVDDDAATCRLLGQSLARLGYQVVPFTDAQEALTKVMNDECDVVVLDFEMPQLNGAQWCSQLRAQPGECAAIPVIMLTAHAGEAEEIACLDAGANDFVTKPVSLAVLRARIETQLRLRAMNSQLQQQKIALEEWHVERERDLEAAQLTQRALLPTDIPKIAGWNGAAIYLPLIHVGGDVFGWELLRNGSWLVWIADATGHGASAALLTTLARNLFHQAADFSEGNPADILDRVNRQLHEVFRSGTYMTAACLCLHPNHDEVTLAFAGHPPVAVVHSSGKTTWTKTGGPLLGIQTNAHYESETISVKPGETLLLYTDGLHSVSLAQKRRQTHLDLVRHFEAAPNANAFLKSLMAKIEAEGKCQFTDDVAAIAWTREL